MSKEINRHGLKRYIPAPIRENIRKDAGFGCVICGCVLVDYEHIDPEWADAKEHDPKKMTLLCINCHGRVSRKLISKQKVWEAKNNPRALQDGYVQDMLFVDTRDMEIKIGNSLSKNTKTILTIQGKPIIWFEPPICPNEPTKLCAIFYDDKGSPIAYINRNQFIALTTGGDIKSESTELSISLPRNKLLLIDREGDKILHIKKLRSSYLNSSVCIQQNDSLLITQGESNFTLGQFHVENCGSAISLGSIPKIRKYTKLFAAISLGTTNTESKITTLFGKHVGWFLGNEILNKDYEVVGYVKCNEVFNITDEYIGLVDGNNIICPDDCYNDGEPIYVSNVDRAADILKLERKYDLSSRLFEQNT